MNDRVQFVEDWFAGRGITPFQFQRDTWKAYLRGESGLIHAPTGTGKTLAAWLGPVAEWLQANPDADAWPEEIPLTVLWVTPLRALAADTTNALRAPIDDLRLPWTVERRTGDVSSSVRNRQQKRLPTALVTTPESLSLFLTRANAAELFQHVRCVVVDEWHELVGSKRGVQVQLALARLRTFCPGIRIWGMSATIGNIETAAQTLGVAPPNSFGGGKQSPRVIYTDLPKPIRIDALIPNSMERFPWAGHLGLRMREEVIEAIAISESTLLFTNTRAHAETWYQALLEAKPEWGSSIAIHHGSIDAEARAEVEKRLANGELRAVVCTSSLDLGVDFQPVERVLQMGSPKGVARLLQRAGRSGHRPGAESRVTCVPAHAFELIESAAARAAVESGRIELREAPRAPVDVLVQHVVTAAMGGGFTGDALYEELKRTHSYRDMSRDSFQWVLDFVEHGGQTLHAYPEYKRIAQEDGRYVVKDTEIAKRHRMSVGTIVSDSAFRVKYVKGANVGMVEEAFLARLRPGDTFIASGKVLELVRIRDMTAYVRKAKSAKAAIPRWMGGRIPLSTELAESVLEKLGAAHEGTFVDPEMEAVRPILELQRAWSAIPRPGALLVERFKTRFGHHLVFYPFAGRLVHEGLAALFAYRLARRAPATFSFAANDYGFELTAAGTIPFDADIALALCSSAGLEEDLASGMNIAELAKRHFREIARVAGLVFQGYPGAGKTTRQVQASSGLFYDVFRSYDPENLLLKQAYREVYERQLERERLDSTLQRMRHAELMFCEPPHATPLAFPLIVDNMRERLSTEAFSERVARMQVQLERAAQRAGVSARI